MKMQLQEDLTRLLMSHGITPNYKAFFFFSYALSQAKNGHPITSSLFEETASHFHISKGSLLRNITRAYHRMHNPPSLPACKKNKISYPLIQELLRELET